VYQLRIPEADECSVLHRIALMKLRQDRQPRGVSDDRGELACSPSLILSTLHQEGILQPDPPLLTLCNYIFGYPFHHPHHLDS
jgi:hypothetical protein